jgi:hypothetical protein
MRSKYLEETPTAPRVWLPRLTGPVIGLYTEPNEFTSISHLISLRSSLTLFSNQRLGFQVASVLWYFHKIVYVFLFGKLNLPNIFCNFRTFLFFSTNLWKILRTELMGISVQSFTLLAEMVRQLLPSDRELNIYLHVVYLMISPVTQTAQTYSVQ